MLKKIEIKNFKNIDDATIIFKTNLTGIYGPNGIGKTSIIELIAFLREEFNNTDKEQFTKMVNKKIRVGTNEMKYTFYFELEAYKFKVSKTYNNVNSEISYKELIEYSPISNKGAYRVFYEKNTENNSDVLQYRFFNDYYKLDTSIQSMNMLVALSSLSTKLMDNIVFNKQQQKVVNEYKLLQSILKNTQVIELKDSSYDELLISIPKHLVEKEQQVLFKQFSQKYTLHEYGILKSTFESISKLLKVIVKGKTLELKVTSNENQMVTVELCTVYNNVKVNIADESAGIVKLISVISGFLNLVVDENALVIIDELDAHIYEYLLSVIIRELKNNLKGQLIFTSHNLTLFECLQKNNLIIANSPEPSKVEFTYFKKVAINENMRNKYIRAQSLGSCPEIASSNIDQNFIVNTFFLYQYERGLHE